MCHLKRRQRPRPKRRGECVRSIGWAEKLDLVDHIWAALGLYCPKERGGDEHIWFLHPV